MTTVPTRVTARKAPLFDRLFVAGCTFAYLGLMASVAYALHLG